MLRIAAQAIFLVVVAVFVVWGIATQWDAIVDGLGRVSAVLALVSVATTVLGYVALFGVWLLVVRRYGHPLAWARGAAIFFLGQLGRYIPGSVWSFAAQAALGRGAGVPAVTMVVASLVALGYLLAVAIATGLAVIAGGMLAVPIAPLLAGLLAVAVLAGTVPPIVNALGSKLSRARLSMTFAATGTALTLSLASVVAMGSGVVALAWPFLPGSATVATIVGILGAFALAYGAGLVVVIAPAGIGVRDALLVLLLGPMIGVANATIVAILSRVTSTIADLVVAFIAWLFDRWSSRRG